MRILLSSDHQYPSFREVGVGRRPMPLPSGSGQHIHDLIAKVLAEQETVEQVCALHLQAALLNVSLVNTNRDEETTATLHYVMDRLNYVNDRIALIY